MILMYLEFKADPTGQKLVSFRNKKMATYCGKRCVFHIPFHIPLRSAFTSYHSTSFV